MNRYTALQKIVELGSFSKAAAALGYTQSSMSQMIASLEHELSIKLLNRSRSGVRLTLEGAVLPEKHPLAAHEAIPLETLAAEPFILLEEADPTGLVLFHTLSGAKNFTVSVLIYRNRHQNGYILILSAPVPPQIDPVHIDIRIASAL